MARAKRVLIVAHDFPPYRTSGVYRITGLTKYLSSLGWEPTVLAGERHGETEDASLLSRIPREVEVARAKSPRFAFWEEPAARALKSVGALKTRNNGHREPRGDTALRRAGDLLRSCIYFPDETIPWVPFAVAKAMKMHQRSRFDAVLSSGPPRSCAIVGYLLRLFLNVPWILEFRDPWWLSPRPLRRRCEAKLESFLLSRADGVVVLTEGHAREFGDKWGVPREKLTVIRNGFDEDDFRNSQETQAYCLPSEYFHFSYFGEIYPGNTGQFFAALRALAKESPDLTRLCRVNIIGYSGPELNVHVDDPYLKPLIHTHKFVPHPEAIRIMRASDCLLLFWADPHFSRLAVAGKTYEYLRIGRPILAVTSKGEIQLLIEEGEAGWVAPPNDLDAIKRILKELLLAFQQNGYRPKPVRAEFATQFRYDVLAGRMVGVFNKVMSHAG